MRKILIVLIMALIPISLYAIVTDHVYINGYYEEAEANLIFRVWASDSNLDMDRIYHAGDIYTDDDPTIGEVTIFNWELSGNKNMDVTITFTITPLQAFSNGTYYVPKHTVKMTDGTTLKTHEFATSTSGSSSYPGYRQGSSGPSSFIVNSASFTYNENVKKNHPKSGYCTLQILEYDEDTAGNFDYVSYVTVEFNAT